VQNYVHNVGIGRAGGDRACERDVVVTATNPKIADGTALANVDFHLQALVQVRHLKGKFK